MNTLQDVDYAGVMQRLDNDKDLWLELITLFEETSGEQLEAISAAIYKQDASAIGATAHAIKGALGNVGAAKGQATALSLERLGKSGDVSTAPALFAQLKSEIQAFFAATAAYK